VSTREIRITELIGRRVRDPQGRSIGRIEELVCEIELRPGGRDYVVREIHVGAAGFLESLAGTAFARSVLRTAGRVTGYRIPWEAMDLSDSTRPRLAIALESLRTTNTDRSG
jgi:sporulation protein YlmC with PRC-barrel domain